MRMTIVCDDRLIIIDQVCLMHIEQDLSWIPSDVHALQWYDSWGEIEYKDRRPNQKITDLGIYEQAIIDHTNELERIKEKERIEYEEKEKSRNYLEELRNLRNGRLSVCDWTQTIDVPISESKKIEWQLYRQQLRDLPETITDARSMVLDENHPDWPIPPL